MLCYSHWWARAKIIAPIVVEVERDSPTARWRCPGVNSQQSTLRKSPPHRFIIRSANLFSNLKCPLIKVEKVFMHRNKKKNKTQKIPMSPWGWNEGGSLFASPTPVRACNTNRCGTQGRHMGNTVLRPRSRMGKPTRIFK